MIAKIYARSFENVSVRNQRVITNSYSTNRVEKKMS